MARRETPAAERARQRRAVADQVSAELGYRVGVEKAAQIRQAQRRKAPAEMPYLVTGRTVNLEGANLERIGQVLARVVDFKVVRGGLALLSLQTSAAEFAHVLTDASLLSQGQSLLATLDRVSARNGD